MSIETKFPRSMSPQDATFWLMEGDPTLRSTACAVALLDRSPNRDVVRDKLLRASRAIPRLRQRVLELPSAVSTPVWSEDPYFDIDYHVRHIGVPRGGSLRSVLDFAAAVAMQAFDPSRPLWEFTIVDGLPNGSAALVQKLHHAVTDGAGGIALMEHVYDRERIVSFDPLPESLPEGQPVAEESVLDATANAIGKSLLDGPKELQKQLARGLNSLAHPLATTRDALDGLASLGDLVASGPGPLSPIMTGRSSRFRFSAFSVDAESLKAAAHSCDCKFTDAFLAALAGGWRRYHLRHGAEANQLRAAIPINTRDPHSDQIAGNNVGVARFTMVLDELNPRLRMQTIRSQVKAEREGANLNLMSSLSGMLNMMPASLALPLFRSEARKGDFVATAVPGLPIPLFMAGAQIESLYTFGPPAGTGANITLFTYLDEAGIAINTDPAAVPDREVLEESMKEGFDEILKLA